MLKLLNQCFNHAKCREGPLGFDDPVKWRRHGGVHAYAAAPIKPNASIIDNSLLGVRVNNLSTFNDELSKQKHSQCTSRYIDINCLMKQLARAFHCVGDCGVRSTSKNPTHDHSRCAMVLSVLYTCTSATASYHNTKTLRTSEFQ